MMIYIWKYFLEKKYMDSLSATDYATSFERELSMNAPQFYRTGERTKRE